MMTSAKKKRKNICRKRQEKEHLSEKVSEKAVWFSKVPGHPSVRQVPIWQVHVPAHVPVHVPGPDPAGTCTSCTDVPDIYVMRAAPVGCEKAIGAKGEDSYQDGVCDEFEDEDLHGADE